MLFAHCFSKSDEALKKEERREGRERARWVNLRAQVRRGGRQPGLRPQLPSSRGPVSARCPQWRGRRSADVEAGDAGDSRVTERSRDVTDQRPLAAGTRCVGPKPRAAGPWVAFGSVNVLSPFRRFK